MNISIEDIKREIIPALFAAPVMVGSYGAGQSSSQQLDEVNRMLTSAPSSRLMVTITEVLKSLAATDPAKVFGPWSAMARWRGEALEAQVGFLVERKRLDHLLGDVSAAIPTVRNSIIGIDKLLEQLDAECWSVAGYILAGQEYLQEHPDAGLPQPQALEFDNTRERFARRLANLQTLLVSHEQGIPQLKMMKMQLMAMLDRLDETVSVLIPVWRQNMLSISIGENLGDDSLRKAIQAHEALRQSLVVNIQLKP